MLHTAFGESSRELAGYLEAMGVRGCFGRLFWPDLINTHNFGPDFYARLLADASAKPCQALVVDDSPAALGGADRPKDGARGRCRELLFVDKCPQEPQPPDNI